MTCSAKSQAWPGWSTRRCLRPLTDVSDLWELAGSRAFEQGSIAILEARWVLNIPFFSFDLHVQTPDGNFASSDKMIFLVAYISYINEEWAEHMLSCYVC